MFKDLICVDPSLLSKWNRPVPRYTSYPTAPQFKPIEESIYLEKLAQFNLSDKPLSLYIHIPFCKTMCLFCGCSVVLNRKPERQATYLVHLLKEIRLTAGRFSTKRIVTQLHLGGGTPTSLTEIEFERLMETLQEYFIWAPDAEISIEIDPRTVFA
ncbi:MAG: radical SAM protein, partial [Chlamydiota bacterium]